MIRIVKTREVAASVDQIWDLISNLEDETRYWPVIKSTRILSRSLNKIEREATILRGPMGNVKSIQTLLLKPKKSLTLQMTKGPLIGTRTIILDPIGRGRARIDIVWKFDLEGIPAFAESFVRNNISDLTEKALAMISKRVEG